MSALCEVTSFMLLTWRPSSSVLRSLNAEDLAAVEEGASLSIYLLSWALPGKRDVGTPPGKRDVGNHPVQRAVAFFSFPTNLPAHPRNSLEDNSYHPQSSLSVFLDELKSPLSLLISNTGRIPRTPTKRNEMWDRLPMATD